MSSHSSYQNTNLAKYLNELTSPSPKQDLKPKKSQERLENSVMEIQVKLDLIRRIRSNFCIDLLQAKKFQANTNNKKQAQFQNEIMNRIKTEFVEIFPKNTL